MQIKELIDVAIQRLNKNGIEDSRIKAKVLLQYTLNQDKFYVLMNGDEEIKKKDEARYKNYIEELIQGKPLQYITNNQEFMGLNFYVDENVLIPQPDTEILVEEAIGQINSLMKEDKASQIRILDLCTGSGAIAISVAKYLQENVKDFKKEYEICAVDISEKALEVAEKNAKQNDVQVKFILSNMFENIKNSVEEKFDMIISNPPYIEKRVIETLSREVQNEPHIALDGGEDGLDFYRTIANKGNQYLKDEGSILLEIGYNQKENVTRIFEEEQKYRDIECVQDLSGNDRVIKVKIKED